jgi:hypothetical protein
MWSELAAERGHLQNRKQDGIILRGEEKMCCKPLQNRSYRNEVISQSQIRKKRTE